MRTRVPVSCCGTHGVCPLGQRPQAQARPELRTALRGIQRGAPARPHLHLFFQSSSLNEAGSGLFHLFLRLVYNHVIRIGGK